MKFGEFFGRNEQKGEWEIEQERRADRAREELNSIKLEPDEIVGEMSPEEVYELNYKIGDLLSRLPENETGWEELAPGEEIPAVPHTIDIDEMFGYLGRQPARVLGYLLALVEESLLEPGIGEKFRQHERAHWKEVFRKEIEKGVTPFGDMRHLIKDISLKEGIDLENPTEGDVNAFFQGRRYAGGSIATELRRRIKEGYADIGVPAREAMSVALSFLLRKTLSPRDPEKDWYQDEEKQERLLGIKERLIDLIKNPPQLI